MKTFCWMCLTILLLAASIAQAGEGEWRTYTVADGLVSPNVTGIFQDSRGDMWFITDKGVSRFDGENFRSFTQKDGLPGGPIRQILEDKNGHLWFLFHNPPVFDGGEHGTVIRYDGVTFHQITEQDGLAGGFSNAMLKDKHGNLWFANAYGLTKYDGKGFQSFGVQELQGFIGAKDRADAQIHAIFESQNGDIWLGGGYKHERNLPPFVIRYDGSAFHHFPLDAFLTSTAIYAIAEDGAGNLLFGGYNVLYRYDGVSFELFENEVKVEEGKPATLKSGLNSVTITGPPGHYFLIPYKELPLPKQYSTYSVFSHGASVYWMSGPFGGRKIIGDYVTISLHSFLEDSGGRLWFNMGEFLFLWDGNQLHHFPSLNGDTTKEPVPFDEKGQPYWFPGEPVLEDGSGNLWFKNGNGVHRYDGTSFQTFTVDDGLGSDNVSVIFQDRDGKFWFGHDNGVTSFDPAPVIENFTTRGALGSNNVDLIYEDKNGFVWFSVPGGVARYNGKELQYFSWKQIGNADPNTRIISILDDGKDGVWFVGDWTSRIFRYKAGQFRRYNIYGNASGRSIHETNKFIFDSEGNLWLAISTPESPIRCDGERSQSLTERGWKGVPQWGIHVGPTPITDLHADRKGNIWFASNEGVKRYDEDRLKTIFTTADGLGSDKIEKIFEDNDGNLWFVSGVTTTPDASRDVVYVSRYDGVSIQNFSIEPIQLYNMHQDVRGVLWFIGHHGIWRYDGTDFDPVLTRDVPVVEMISVENLRASITDRAGNLWLDTRNGAIKYDGVQFHIYTTADGFLINDIRDVHEDKQGNIWFATWGGGIVRYNGETFQAITTKHGLINNNVRRIFEDSRGYLWFATNGGITKYTPKGLEIPPRIKLTKVIADKVYTDFDEALQLPAKVRRVAFEYQGFSLRRANLLYTHKLAGRDTDWSRPSPENRVEYKGLKPGRYVFLVKALREDLEYANPPATVVFTIAEPFYMRLGFIVPVSLGGLFTLLLFYQRRAIVQLTRRLFRAEEQVKHTQAQLIQSEKMATVGTLAGGVAHEINNPLDAILGSVQRILRFAEDPKIVESAKSAQEGTRRCKDIVEKLLKYARQSSEAFAALDVNQVIEDTVALLGHQLKLEKMTLEMQLTPGLKVQGNFTELSQVVTNLLINAKDAIVAARATGKEAGLITVRTASTPPFPPASEGDKGGYVLIEVTDDGIGIPEEHLGKLFDPFFTTKPVGKGTGLGLSICQGIVEKHQGRMAVESKVGEGATFRVFLPRVESTLEKV